MDGTLVGTVGTLLPLVAPMRLGVITDHSVLPLSLVAIIVPLPVVLPRTVGTEGVEVPMTYLDARASSLPQRQPGPASVADKLCRNST